MLSPKNLIRLIINTVIGVVLIFLWLHFVNLSEVYDHIKTADFKFLIIFLIAYLCATFFRSLRFKILLKRYNLAFKRIVFLTFLAQFLSFMIPIRAGEIAKGVYLSTFLKQNLPKTLTWVFIDRFLDFWVYILVAAILMVVLSISLPSVIGQGIIIATASFSVAAVLMILGQNLARKLANLLLPGFLKSFANTIIDQFSLLRLPVDHFASLILLTILAIISDSIVLLSVLLALGVNLNFIKVVFGNALITLTFLIPAAPGYVGSAEASGLVVLSGVLGLDPNLASSVAVLQHLLNLVILPTVGISSIYFLKFNLRLVWERLRNKN